MVMVTTYDAFNTEEDMAVEVTDGQNAYNAAKRQLFWMQYIYISQNSPLLLKHGPYLRHHFVFLWTTIHE